MSRKLYIKRSNSVLLWDCLSEECQKKLMQLMARLGCPDWQPPNGTPSRVRYDLKQESSEELARLMEQRPHHPGGEGYRLC